MIILQIGHKVPDYNNWKKAFESDPVGRRKSGVRRHRILRPSGDSNYVIIHLEFDTLEAAENMLAALRKLWTNVEGKIMLDPETRILDVVETMEY